MAEAAHAESLAGRIVVMPHVNMKTWAPDAEDADRIKPGLDLLHRAKIRMAREILVVGDYVPGSTRAEIEYARWLGMPVRFTHPEIDPAAARAEVGVDELAATESRSLDPCQSTSAGRAGAGLCTEVHQGHGQWPCSPRQGLKTDLVRGEVRQILCGERDVGTPVRVEPGASAS